MHNTTAAPSERAGRWTRAIAETRLSTAWVVAAIAVPTAIAISTPLSSVDLTYQLRAGELMLDTGRILRTDVFTVSAFGDPWLDQQWGAQVVLAAIFRGGGWLALALFRGVATALVTSMVYASCRNAGASRRWAAGLTLTAGLFATGGFLVRPQLFGMVCFAATQWLLSAGRPPQERALGPPPGGRLGEHARELLPGASLVRDRGGARRAAANADRAAAPRDGPRGDPPHPAEPVRLSDLELHRLDRDRPRIRNGVVEWQSPTIETVAGTLFLVSVVAVAVFVGWRWRDVTWPTFAGLGFFLVLGLSSIRASLWWLLAAPVLIAPLTPRAPRERADPRSRLNAALVGILCLLALAPLIRWLPYPDRDPPGSLLTSAPAGITRALEDAVEPGQPIFNAQRWGSWFEFALPDNPVFVDSRWEVVPDAAWDDYGAVSDGRQGWEGILDGYGFDVVALAREEQASLLSLIEHDPEWRLVHRDGDGAVFVRASA